jgi:hypothetical protein
MFAGVATLMHNRPGDVGASGDAFRDDFLLGFVVVAAAAGNEQSAQGLGGKAAGGEAGYGNQNEK